VIFVREVLVFADSDVPDTSQRSFEIPRLTPQLLNFELGCVCLRAILIFFQAEPGNIAMTAGIPVLNTLCQMVYPGAKRRSRMH
jgi:hypothetical protein